MENTLYSGSTDTPVISKLADKKSYLRRAALDAANRVRKQLGKPPVDHLYPGMPANGDRCAVTNTIYNDDDDLRQNFRVKTLHSRITVFDKRGNLFIYQLNDEYTRRFTMSFDRGQYPDLEL